MADISPLGRKAIDQARRGEFEQALATAKEAIGHDPKDKGLRLFAGLLHSRRSEFGEAAAQLREALRLAPDDPLVRVELVRVLGALGEIEEAEALLGRPGVPEQQSRRLRAMLAARRGDHAIAAKLYGETVRHDPRDFEAWGNLGVSLLAVGDSAGAVSALERALALRPDHSNFRQKWADAHAAAGTADEALAALHEQGAGNPATLVTAARLEDLQQRPDRALETLQRALEADPANEAALVALAELQERGNRIDDFEQSLELLRQRAPSAEKLPLLCARAAYRRGEMDAALEFAEQARPDVDPASRAQLIGQVNDRLGNFDVAFEVFEQMNRLDSLTTEDAEGKTERYVSAVNERRTEVLTADWASGWPDAPPPEREPAFLVGFPRSGTTLLDTLLMGDPEVAVSEENPMLTNLSRMIGAFERIANLSAGEVAMLRQAYFDEAENYLPNSRGLLLLDKFPFGLGAGPLIHRLFPTAPIIFLSRHPCDVVLSCFMNRFQPTDIGSAFLTLDGTARLYDGMMRLWTRSRELLPLRVLDVRYESLVQDPKPEMQRVAGFLGIGWSDDLIDNRPSAKRRGFIKTPSYSQVAEPIYQRAVERWRNYSEQLRPVLPTLEPWIEALGYEG
jgi:tetratricopeptide (TPR) repeat protein